MREYPCIGLPEPILREGITKLIQLTFLLQVELSLGQISTDFART